MDAFKRKNRRMFISFSSSFLLFIIIPILVLNIAAWQAIKITGQNERQNCVRILADGRDKMDSRIKSIQSITALLRVDTSLSSLERLNSPVPTGDYYHIWLALQSIGRMELANQGWDMIIYSRKSDLVLSPTFMAGYMSAAYGTFFRFGDNSYADFLSGLVVNGNRPVFFPAMEYTWEKVPLRGLLYGLRLRVSGDTTVFFLLREQYILDLFSPIFSSKGALYIYDAGGRLLFSQGGGFPPEHLPEELPQGSGLLADGFLGPGIISAYSKSDYGLFYVSALETDAVLNHVRTLQNLTLGLNITAVFLSLGYAAFLAARNSRQVAEAFRLLDGSPNFPSYEGGNILRYLNNAVSRLVNTNALLQEDAHSRHEALRGAFLDRLLAADWESPEEAAAAAEQAGIPLAGRRFCVVFLLFKPASPLPASRLDHARQGVIAALGELPPGEALIYHRNPNRLGVFFFLQPERWESFRTCLEGFFQTRAAPVCAANGALLFLAGSGLCDDLFKLQEGYNLCREYSLIGEEWNTTGIHWIDKLPLPRQRIFVFPLETEQKLINQLQSADFEGAGNSIRLMFAANLHEGLLGETMLTIFYTTLQGCLLRALEGPLMDLYRDAVQNLDFHRFPEDLEREFTELARKICASFEAEYSKKNAAIKKEDLIAYVEEHFGEERLSLRLAARHFGFSESYFSQMFKDITGENFSTVMEVTRLRQAQTLLKQYLKVEEAAYRCGYKSPGTFRRAYKRYFGINPDRSR